MNRTALPTTVPELVQIYSLTNSEYVYQVANWSQNSTQLNFNVTLNTGKYGFKLYDDVYGWYSLTTNTVLSVSKSSSTYTLSTTQTSFNGGSITVVGDYIGDGAVITINGYKGKVLMSNNSAAVFQVPQLVTPVTQSAFHLAKNKTISLNDKLRWGDTAGW